VKWIIIISVVVVIAGVGITGYKLSNSDIDLNNVLPAMDTSKPH